MVVKELAIVVKFSQLALKIQNHCGGLPCFIMCDTLLGCNKFHLRALVNSEWSLWGECRNYDADDIGHPEYEEL